MDVNGGHGRPHSYGSCKRQDLPVAHSGVSAVVSSDKVQDASSFTGQSPISENCRETSASQLMQYRAGSLRANMLVKQSEGSTTFNQGATHYKRVQSCYSAPEPDTLTGDPIGSLSSPFFTERVSAASAVGRDSYLTGTDSGQTSDFVSVTRSTPRFASTRHQSFGSLSVQAGVVGLSSNSATLAFMPLRASDELSKTSVQSSYCPIVPSSASAVRQNDESPSVSACSCDLATNVYPKVSNAGISGTAAAIWDRRIIFFSEAPKPVSLGAERPQSISSASFVTNAEDRLKPEAAGSTTTTSSQSGYNFLTSSSSDRLTSLGEGLCKLSMSSDAKLDDRSPSGLRQQLSPPVSAFQTMNSSPSVPRADAPKSLSVQSDSGFLSSRSKESPEVDFFSMSPPEGSPKDSSAGNAWYRSSPQNQLSPSPLVNKDTAFWESGESGCHYLPSSSEQHTSHCYDAFSQSLPSNLSPLVTPPKVGNIQKLKAFFGETTPRIMEAKSTDPRTSVNESTENSVDSESPVDIKRTAVVETNSATKAVTVTTASVLLDRSVVTAKGKKMANWVLASRHHSSHPQLQGTRPKKPLTDREPSLSPKQKEHRTWKGKVVRTFKRHSSSSAVVTSDTPSQSEEITGTFGVPLECCYPSIMNELVPLIVEVCTQVVAERGIENQGIYRVPGNSVAINTLVEELNRDPESACLDNEKWQDVNSVSSLLKLFFRKLPDSLITDDLYEDVMTANRIENSERRMLKLKKLLHELPEHNFETFRFLAQHLNKVASREEHNKMDAHNLAIVFGPTLVRPQDNSMVVMVKDMADQCRVVETIIVHCDWFFSSWDEDVNVPIDELSGDATPISSMNQQLLAKAESLAVAPFYRDFMSSIVRAKPGKIKNHFNKSKSADHYPASSFGVSRLASCVSGELSPLPNVCKSGKVALEVRRYPAHRFEHTASVTPGNNSKPYVLHRASHSCESLRLHRIGHSELICKTARIGGSALPPSYQYCSSSYRIGN